MIRFERACCARHFRALVDATGCADWILMMSIGRAVPIGRS